jgi:hypothetical protein
MCLRKRKPGEHFNCSLNNHELHIAFTNWIKLKGSKGFKITLNHSEIKEFQKRTQCKRAEQRPSALYVCNAQNDRLII